ncbi:hypothetical protein GOV04_06005 [Candidatus Woesearchaeota archaeon]|nr:hypothetical protein [Candidatus Woesearchaeota archaeon]
MGEQQNSDSLGDAKNAFEKANKLLVSTFEQLSKKDAGLGAKVKQLTEQVEAYKKVDMLLAQLNKNLKLSEQKIVGLGKKSYEQEHLITELKKTNELLLKKLSLKDQATSNTKLMLDRAIENAAVETVNLERLKNQRNELAKKERDLLNGLQNRDITIAQYQSMLSSIKSALADRDKLLSTSLDNVKELNSKLRSHEDLILEMQKNLEKQKTGQQNLSKLKTGFEVELGMLKQRLQGFEKDNKLLLTKMSEQNVIIKKLQTLLGHRTILLADSTKKHATQINNLKGDFERKIKNIISRETDESVALRAHINQLNRQVLDYKKQLNDRLMREAQVISDIERRFKK